MAFGQSEYDASQEKSKWKERGTYALALFLRGVFYFLKLVLQAIWGGVKGVLQAFGLPLR